MPVDSTENKRDTNSESSDKNQEKQISNKVLEENEKQKPDVNKTNEQKEKEKKEADNVFGTVDLFDSKVDSGASSASSSMPDKNLDSSNLKSLYQKNLSKIDKDGDGSISQPEIDVAIDNSEFVGADAQFVSTLKRHGAKIAVLSDDNDNSTISGADIDEFERQQKSTKLDTDQLFASREYLDKNFDKLDADDNGEVSQEEIAECSRNESNSESTSVALSRLEVAARETGVGLTRESYQKYIDETFSQPENAMVFGVNNSFSNSGRILSESNPSIYGSQNPLDSIKPEAVKQGAVGNCYFMAALSSLASTNPRAIKNMINENEDGTFTVTFPGDSSQPITVSRPTDAELTLYGGDTGKYGIWAAVMEKAYGKYCNENLLARSPLSPTRKDIDQEGGEGGSMLNAGLRILTGKSVDSDTLAFTSEEELETKLKSAMEDGRPVDCGINNELGAIPILPFALSDNKTDDLGLQCGHEYSVIGYNSETKMVKVRNPWGRGEPTDANGKPLDGTDDGVFEISVSQFRNNFSSISYSTK